MNVLGRVAAFGDGCDGQVVATFGAVAAEHPEVVCNIHLGLLRGALERLSGGGATAKITPWVTPTMCRAAAEFNGANSANGALRVGADAQSRG